MTTLPILRGQVGRWNGKDYDVEQIQTNDHQTKSGVIDLWMESLVNNTPPEISGEEALYAMRAVFASLDSARTGTSVDIPEIAEEDTTMMKFGLLTAILDGWTYEEAVDIAAQMGFRCLEVACWPAGKAERRYAGVSHIDCARVLDDDAYARHVVDYAAGKGLTISSLAFIPTLWMLI